MFHRRKRPYNARNYGHDSKKFKSQHVDILPDFSPSGLLELESNNREGIALKHVEPQDAISPDKYMDMLGLQPDGYKRQLNNRWWMDPLGSRVSKRGFAFLETLAVKTTTSYS